MPVAIDGLLQLCLPCPVDSGSLGNRFARWVADAASIDRFFRVTIRAAVYEPACEPED